MTPRQARIALGGFVLMTGGVAFNALHMQGDAIANRKIASEPAPPRPPADRVRRTEPPPAGRPGPRATDGTKRTALVKPDSAKATITPEGLRDEASTETVRAIQRELSQRGFGPLASDGIMRPVTRAAIMSYEAEHRLPYTGEATEALLARLVLGAPATTDASGAGQVQSPHAEALIKQIQRMLTASGYSPGPVDGRFSAETAAAIRAFEERQGLVPRGRISADILSRLQERARG